MKSLANEFFVTMAEGAKAHQAANAGDYTLVVNGIRNESDLAQQVALVEQMMAQGVDAIVIAPADSARWCRCWPRRSVRRSSSSTSTTSSTQPTLQQAGIDDSVRRAGQPRRARARSAPALATQLQRGDKVAILEGIPTAFNAQQRRLGFEDAMREAGIDVVAVQSAHWEQDEANTVARGDAARASGPQGDSRQQRQHGARRRGRGAAGRAGPAQVLVVGFDNIAAVQQLLQDGRVLATADQHADRLAVFGIEYALQILRGEARPTDMQTPVDLIAADQK